MEERSAVSSAASFTIRPIVFTAFMLMPAREVATLTELQTFSVSESASGME